MSLKGGRRSRDQGGRSRTKTEELTSKIEGLEAKMGGLETKMEENYRDSESKVEKSCSGQITGLRYYRKQLMR